MIGHEQKMVRLFVARPAFLRRYSFCLSFHRLVCASCFYLLWCYFREAVLALCRLCLFHACTFFRLLVLQTRMEKFDRHHDSRFCFVRASGNRHFGHVELLVIAGLHDFLSSPSLIYPISRQEASHA